MITLTGKPISTNSLYKTTCTGRVPRIYMTQKGKDLKEQYQWEAKSQWKKPITDDEIALNIILYFGDNRKHDIDNYSKILLDALTGIVYEDDSQIAEIHIIKERDDTKPRIEVYVAS